MRRNLTAGLLAICLAISGCSTVSNQPYRGDPKILFQENISLNESLESWSLRGKIGVKSGRKGGSATIKWQYQEQQQDIELYGPFGGGRIIITTQPGSAELRDTKGNILTGNTAQEVLYRKIGWRVPFDELVMWSRGLVNEGATNIVIDRDGNLKRLQQGIWQVEYEEHENVAGYNLPRKFKLTSIPGELELFDKKGEYVGDSLSVKVILKSWTNLKNR